MVLTFFGLGLVSVASLGLAIPVPQFQSWTAFFLPEQTCDPPGNRPYSPYAVQAPRYPYGPQPYYSPLPPPCPPTPYVPGTREKPTHPPEEKPGALPPNYGPANEKAAAQPNTPASSNGEGSTEENSMRYHVNVGGIQKGAGGGTTNFHVYTDENGTKKFSDELDPETEKYITENMIPKLGNKRRKGGGVWSVFGGNR
ncbi:hypothetical protein C7212DRAFT_348225 [Tuber magnatum]|uniref:Uncharacterized protein n=1 Tax=Tuber magnatum TaxID=42249 RepID=A0A317SDT9_9PEZI|nr:hypothetical protein C7212DRAFT_348225 [Tuber magnatum]